MTRVLLDRPYLCPICQRKVGQLYPLTRYDPHAKRWTAGKACLACCGPTGEESVGFNIVLHRAIQR